MGQTLRFAQCWFFILLFRSIPFLFSFRLALINGMEWLTIPTGPSLMISAFFFFFFNKGNIEHLK